MPRRVKNNSVKSGGPRTTASLGMHAVRVSPGDLQEKLNIQAWRRGE